MVSALHAAQIDSRNFWHPLHTQAPYAAAPASFANSIDISRRGLWLPSRLDLAESDIDRVSAVIVQALRRVTYPSSAAYAIILSRGRALTGLAGMPV